MTIGWMRDKGLTDYHVICGHCAHSVVRNLTPEDRAEWELADLKRRYRCSECGARPTLIMPTWEGWKAEGIGPASTYFKG